MDFIAFKNIYFYILFNQMHYVNIAKHRCMHYLFGKENQSQIDCLIHSFWFL